MKKAIYLIFGTAILWGCDALNQNPSTSMTTDTAITSVEDLSNAVNGAYYLATYGDMLTMGSEMAIYGDLCGPDSNPQSSSGQNPSRFAQFIQTADDTYKAYYYLYSALASVNMAIEAAGSLEDQEGAAPYVAELYAMRGLFHFHLATFFAPIPTSGNTSNTMGLVLSNQVFPIDYIGARATLDETYQQIVDDFTTAIESGQNMTANTGHMNYWAALALRARAYLYWGKYDEALADCRKIISDSPYTLYEISDYEGVWSQEGTSEMIMEYLQTDTYNAQRYAPGYYTSPDGYAEYGVSQDFYDWMKSDTDDVRSNLVDELDGDAPGIYPLKYPGKTGSTVPTYNNNIKVIRLSEVYLIAAEAALLGTEQSASTAAGYINDLREKRITGYSDVTSVTMDDIINERRKELFAEGQIAFDYWRTGRTVTKSATLSISPTDTRAVLPLPTEEIEVSKGVLIQNPGYGQ